VLGISLKLFKAPHPTEAGAVRDRGIPEAVEPVPKVGALSEALIQTAVPMLAEVQVLIHDQDLLQFPGVPLRLPVNLPAEVAVHPVQVNEVAVEINHPTIIL
jgi:hypothetical protein